MKLGLNPEHEEMTRHLSGAAVTAEFNSWHPASGSQLHETQGLTAIKAFMYHWLWMIPCMFDCISLLQYLLDAVLSACRT